MVALVVSFVVTVAMCVPIVWFAKRRKPGDRFTWGEAVVAATWVFFITFLAFGVVPHQWLTYADNELAWRKDAIIMGPGSDFLPNFPFSVTKEAVRDIIVVGIYAVGLGAMIAGWAWWQGRGKAKPAAGELTTSTYGRPLVRKG